MMLLDLIVILGLGWSVSAQDAAATGTATGEPCAQVSSMVAPARAANPRIIPYIPGEVAFQCLQSVPLNSSQALGVTRAIMPYVEFQSDLTFKQKPPSGYPYPANDLKGQLSRIERSVQNGTYANEHAWQMDMFKTFMSAKDGHYRFAGDLLVRPVRFVRNVSVVSVSMDGVAMPMMYVTDDILKMNTSTSSFKPSPITKINNQDPITFAQSIGEEGFQQDPDAAFNTVFYSPALDFTPGVTVQGNFNGDGRAGFTYPGANTTVTFQNGTTNVYHTQARITGNFTGVTSGSTAFQKFCNPPPAVAASPTTTAPTFKPGNAVNNTVRLKGYPISRVSTSDGQASGYYLTSEANKDVGVLSLNSFEPNIPAEFQAVVQTMLAEMKRDGKTKLIVDLQGNGGGIIVNGYDTFRQLFPATQDTLFSRQRLSPVYSTLAQATTDRFTNFSTATSGNLDDINAFESPFNARFALNQNRSRFGSFAEKFGPVSVNGDEMTHLQQLNFDDPNFTINETTGAGMDITGYGSRKNFTQYFKAEDIVMLYDGVCASTCVLFSEMMRNLGGVKSIALGGRPSNTQIQAIGGTKGAQSLTFSGVLSSPSYFLTPSLSSLSSTYPLTAAQKTTLSTLSALPLTRSLDNGINFSDQILKNNVQDGIPAQFIVEKADCKMFYTPAMIQNVSAMWEAAADRAFGEKACVVGGISSGMVSPVKRKREVGEMEMKQMVKEVNDARAQLYEVRMKAVMSPVERMEGWGEVHGRQIPMMYME